MGVTTRYRPSRGRWVVTEASDGKRHQHTFGTEREAEQYATKRRAELNEAAFHGVMGRTQRRTFMEGLLRWVEEYDTESQASSIRAVAQWFDAHAEGVMLGPETVDAARKMQKAMRGLSQSTINNRVQVVKRVLSLAYREWDWLDHPLDAKLRKPTPKNERHVYLGIDDFHALVQAVTDPEAQKVVALAATTGLRRGELLSLRPDNIHGSRIILRPGQTKSGKARVVPLPRGGEVLVEDLPFKVTEHELRKAYEAARKAIGRPEVRLHDLRHTYASLLAEAGEVMTTVQALLGHSSLVVTSRYAHMFDSRLDQVAGRLPDVSDQNATKEGVAEGLDHVRH